jgi:endonuclease III-like uncharacterized protein
MMLIQDEYRGDPWKIMVCCILLNQTSNKQVRPLLDTIFSRFPDPESIYDSDRSEISSMIRSTGFQNIKADRIVKMSLKYCSGFSHPKELPGIGRYGLESWMIFVDNFVDFLPSDKRLSEYIKFKVYENSNRHHSNQV